MEQKTKFTPLYLLSALYIISVYAFLPVWFWMNKDAAAATSQADYSETAVNFPLAIPFVLGIVNLLAVLILSKRTTCEQMLNCALAIKYALIPVFIAGGLCIVLAILMMFTPVVIMVFVGPMLAFVLTVAGWLIMAGAAPYSIAYLVKASREGIHHKALCIVAGILQFVFTADVISLMVLALKEKKWVKATIVLLGLIVLAVLGVIGLIVFAILRAILT